MIGSWLQSSAWLLANRRRYHQFAKALHTPRQAQEKVLADILKRNRDCRFGKQHRFDRINNISQYQSHVPISEYENYTSAINDICQGKQQVLTTEPVRRLVPTSGSSGAAKLIPWTDTLSQQFNRGIGAWVFSLYNRCPALKCGPSYWSISPGMSLETQHASIVPIGFEDDTQYLGSWMSRLVNRMMVVPNVVRHISDMQTFQYVTLLLLLHVKNLRLISVWHPSFLSLLLDSLEKHRPLLLRDIHDGTLTPPGELSPAIRQAIIGRLKPRPQRSVQVEAGEYWPDLQIISCWTDGAAAVAAQHLQQRLPRVTIQSKGLISTEAFVSLPWDAVHPLAVNAHFFEFMDEAGKLHLIDQLDPGCRYAAIVTTGGGLYRYQLHDLVEVDQYVDNTPSIRFIARNNRVSDLCGEKLSEAFVASVIQQVIAFEHRFVMLGVDGNTSSPGYVLFIESSQPVPPNLGTQFDQALRANPHYNYCRGLGQLKNVRIYEIREGAEAIYLKHARRQAGSLGQIKPATLSRDSHWVDVFAG